MECTLHRAVKYMSAGVQLRETQLLRVSRNCVLEKPFCSNFPNVVAKLAIIMYSDNSKLTGNDMLD